MCREMEWDGSGLKDGSQTRGFLHHGNAPGSLGTLHQGILCLAQHVAGSLPILFPGFSDLFVFPKLKSTLKGKRFQNVS